MSEKNPEKTTYEKVYNTVFTIICAILVLLSLRSAFSGKPVGPVLYILGGVLLVGWVISLFIKKIREKKMRKTIKVRTCLKMEFLFNNHIFGSSSMKKLLYL